MIFSAMDINRSLGEADEDMVKLSIIEYCYELPYRMA